MFSFSATKTTTETKNERSSLPVGTKERILRNSWL